MLRGGTGLVAVLVVAVLTAGSLAACGGGSDSTSTTTAAGPTAEKGSRGDRGSSQESKRGGSKGQQNGAGTANEGTGGDNSSEAPSPQGAKVKAAPLKVSGGGSGQFRTHGGDNSIQDFGDEGDETELEEAAAALHGYMVARANEDWDAACSYLSSGMVEQLEQLAKSSKGLKEKGCGAILAALTAPLPPSVRQETTEIDARSLRFEDEQAFLLYSGAGNTDYFIPMAQEDGSWKVAGLASTPLN